MKKKLAVFDLDGTLYRTDLSYVVSVREVFSRHGLPDPGPEEIMSKVGEPLGPILHWLSRFGDAEVLRREIFELDLENVKRRGALFPGVRETLEELRAAGLRLAICSNGSPRYVTTIVRRFGLEPFFERIRFPENGETKPRLVAEILEEAGLREGWMVGDRLHDFEAARVNGLVSVGAAYGYGGDEVKEADRVIARFPELTAILCGN